ncbi:unnamed protein product [Vitrella brassicaformis CCMP3155]|uniref:Uncharacterized protein n=1 Tax=Vitrella brassicaformis (strain CCMP3155) TaxID=1169540 RepID=A0A0G4EVJ9_VITBC|nr:unnamed protein product [Vitrella brassicaformis CCMP3155]|eukprot:CEM02442.1 unnamed protein product [Vitrella brassicaformis CCMP3155]
MCRIAVHCFSSHLPHSQMNGSSGSSVVLPPHLASPANMRGVDAAKRLVAELEKRTLIVNRLITSTGGQQTVTEPLDGEIEINVGGTVLCVPRKPLLLPGVSDSFIAYLLLHHLDGLPKDTDGHPFLDADPIYMDWLCNEVANVGAADAQAETHEIKLTGPRFATLQHTSHAMHRHTQANRY